jgi:general stress protein 26
MEDGTAKVVDILGSMKMAMLTTRSAEGELISRPMAMQEIEFDGDLWFFAERSSASVAHVGAEPQVNVSAYSNDSWISVSGSATVVEDQAKKDELWNAVVEAWFPDGPGPDVVLIQVHAAGAEYWQSAGGRLATAISFVKAKLTHEPYDGGENEIVDLANP